jgi:hypothetical protein
VIFNIDGSQKPKLIDNYEAIGTPEFEKYPYCVYMNKTIFFFGGYFYDGEDNDPNEDNSSDNIFGPNLDICQLNILTGKIDKVWVPRKKGVALSLPEIKSNGHAATVNPGTVLIYGGDNSTTYVFNPKKFIIT